MTKRAEPHTSQNPSTSGTVALFLVGTTVLTAAAAFGQAPGHVATNAAHEAPEAVAAREVGTAQLKAPEGEAADAEIALDRGILQYSDGHYSAAIETLKQAPAGSVAAAYYRGLCYLAIGDNRSAIDELQAVRKSPVAPDATALDLAIAQIQAGDHASAVESLKELTESRPDDASANFLLGVAMFRQGDRTSASRMFQAAAVDGDLAPFSTTYNRLSTGPFDYDQPNTSWRPEPVAPKCWNFTVLTAYEYDSNVTQSPVFSGLGDNVDRDASRFILATFGDFRLIQQPDWVVGLVESTFDSFHHGTDDFDLQDYMGGAYTNFVVGGPFIAGLRYEFHETLVSEEQFARQHRLVPNVSLLEGDFGHTTLYYEFDASDVDAPALIAAQNRSGDNHRVGVTQAIYTWEEEGRIYFGYFYDEAFTSGTDFDGETHQVTARIEEPLTERTIFDAEIRYFWDDYDNPNSLDFFGRPRKDRRIEIRAGLQHNFACCEHLGARLDYTYVNSDSNVQNLFGVNFYEFDRHLFSTQLIYDF